MNKSAFKILVFALATFLAPHICYAPGGSGGAACGNSALERVAMYGTPEELESAIDQRVVELEKIVAGWDKVLARHPNYYETSRVWLDEKVKSASREEKRKIFAKWWTGCSEIKLLDAAVSAVNAQNVEFLLSLGVDPNAPSYRGRTLIMRCPTAREGSVVTHGAPPERTREQQERVLAVYSFLLNHGMSISQQDRDGLNALHLCNDPAIIRLLIKAGADVSIGIDRMRDPSTIRDYPVTLRVVDYRARRIAEGFNWESDALFAIIEQFIPLVNDRRVTAETERLISRRCENPHNAPICARLGKLISARDVDIFKPLKDRNPQASTPAETRGSN